MSAPGTPGDAADQLAEVLEAPEAGKARIVRRADDRDEVVGLCVFDVAAPREPLDERGRVETARAQPVQTRPADPGDRVGVGVACETVQIRRARRTAEPDQHLTCARVASGNPFDAAGTGTLRGDRQPDGAQGPGQDAQVDDGAPAHDCLQCPKRTGNLQNWC